MNTKLLTQWMPKFDALSQRERALVACAIIGGILLIGNTVFVDIPLAQGKVLSNKLISERAELNGLRTQIDALRAGMRDPDEENRRRVGVLRQQFQESRSTLTEHQRLLVQPQDIPLLLERMLAKHAALRLLGLRTLETVPAGEAQRLTAVPAEKKETSGTQELLRKDVVNVWKHGVEIRLQGSYGDLASYLSDLESLPQRLIWGEVRLKAEYPHSELLVKIYTYSLDQAWLKL